MSLLVKNGTIVNAHETLTGMDVLIENGKIAQIGKDLKANEGVEVIDATGKLLFPGFIDPHVHMELPIGGTHSKDDFYTGTCAALAGGVTMIIDFAQQEPKDKSVLEGYLNRKALAAKKAVCDFGLHVTVHDFNEQIAKDLTTLTTEMKEVNSYKFFTAYKGLQMSDENLFKSFSHCGQMGAFAMVHAENGHLVEQMQKKVAEKWGIKGPEGHLYSRQAEIEGEATGRCALIAHVADCPLYVVHVMSEDAMNAVIRAKQRGYRIVGEAVASGLSLDETALMNKDWDVAARYVMSPPLRTKKDQAALQHGIKAGFLDLVGTDHCSFTQEQKRMGKADFRRIPNGIGCIEERCPVIWELMVNTGIINPQQYVKIMSTKAAKLFNVFPKKGIIAEGSDADICIFDPKQEKIISAKTQFSKSDYNVYEGMKVTGVPTTTISHGKVVFANGKLNVEPGCGQFVATPPRPEEFFGGLEEELKANQPKPIIRE